jgi:hypothetical protein
LRTPRASHNPGTTFALQVDTTRLVLRIVRHHHSPWPPLCPFRYCQRCRKKGNRNPKAKQTYIIANGGPIGQAVKMRIQQDSMLFPNVHISTQQSRAYNKHLFQNRGSYSYNSELGSIRPRRLKRIQFIST